MIGDDQRRLAVGGRADDVNARAISLARRRKYLRPTRRRPGSFSAASSHKMANRPPVSVKKETVTKVRRTITGEFLILERKGVELQPMIDQAIAEPPRHFGLQALDLLGLEFDHFAGAQIDQVIVMRFRICS